MSPHRDNSKKFPLLGESVEIFIFLTITMSVAEAWLGGIGEYPPHPSRLAIPPSSVGFASGHRGVLLTSQDSEGILQYLLAMPRPLYQCRALMLLNAVRAFIHREIQVS